jgi:hypothetical protein
MGRVGDRAAACGLDSARGALQGNMLFKLVKAQKPYSSYFLLPNIVGKRFKNFRLE